MNRTIGALALVMAASTPTMVAAQPAGSYTASGTHQCPHGKCIVTGIFTSCVSAAQTLRVRDCCPTSETGGGSTGFTLNYCIASQR